MNNSITSVVTGAPKMLEQSVPGLSIDCVILGFDGKLKVILLKWKEFGAWSLPGGFIYKEEDMDSAAERVLLQRTGVTGLFLQQFATFGHADRRPESDLKILDELMVAATSEVRDWFKQRFISTGYFAFADISKCQLRPDEFSDRCEWVEINKLPKLIFDHRSIIKHALSTIKLQMNYLPIGKSLLPKQFTMGELQRLYEEILGKRLDRGNFQKKMLKLGIFKRLDKKHSGGAHKAPYLYRFDDKKYNSLIKEGIGYL